ncbi:hypothetical protein J6590_025164 [Homalodisca vitripennis]|nr:hypothetical protein J6590_025164 [Homalodisca vitripennis]
MSILVLLQPSSACSTMDVWSAALKQIAVDHEIWLDHLCCIGTWSTYQAVPIKALVDSSHRLDEICTSLGWRISNQKVQNVVVRIRVGKNKRTNSMVQRTAVLAQPVVNEEALEGSHRDQGYSSVTSCVTLPLLSSMIAEEAREQPSQPECDQLCNVEARSLPRRSQPNHQLTRYSKTYLTSFH